LFRGLLGDSDVVRTRVFAGVGLVAVGLFVPRTVHGDAATSSRVCAPPGLPAVVEDGATSNASVTLARGPIA